MSQHSKEVGKKFDSGKLRWGLLPTSPIKEVIKVLMFGAQKYGDRNWQHLENPQERYYDAALRHLVAHKEGEKLDDESGELHLAHAASCILFMLHYELEYGDE